MWWLFHQRLPDGGWALLYGGAALWTAMWAALLLGSLCLLVFAIARIRRGRGDAWRVVWWVLWMCINWALAMVFHALPWHSHEWFVAYGAGVLLGTPWVIYGAWRIVPLLEREGRMVKEERKALQQETSQPTQGS